MRFSQI